MSASTQTTRDELQDFLQFIRAESHILRECPSLLFQRAVNEPDSTGPARAAQRRIEANLQTRPWLRWVNKPQQRDRCILTLTGHSAPVTSCAYSPDGRRIVSGSEEIKVWNESTGAEIHSWAGHSSLVSCCDYSRDGKLIVTGSLDGTLKIWDAETFAEVTTIAAHKTRVSACMFSPDGCRILSGESRTERTPPDPLLVDNVFPSQHPQRGGGWDWPIPFEDGLMDFEFVGQLDQTTMEEKDRSQFDTVPGGELKVWHVKMARGVGTLGLCVPCAYSSDGRRIVAREVDFETILCVAHTHTGDEDYAPGMVYPGEKSVTLEGHSETVNACAFSPNDRRIVSGSSDKTLKLWEVETGREIGTLDGHTSGVLACAYSPDGGRVVSGSADWTLKVWDAETCEELFTLPGHTGTILACAFSPDGRRIASCSHDKTLKVWDAESAAEAALRDSDSGIITACAHSPDGRRIVSVSHDGGLRTWDVETGLEVTTIDGLESRAILGRPAQNFSKLFYKTFAAFSPDGRHIVTNADGTVEVRDAETLQQVASLVESESAIDACSFSPDGKRFVSGSADGSLKLWNSETGAEVSTFTAGGGSIQQCVFSPDGRWVVSKSGRLIIIWDAETMVKFRTLPGDQYAVSPDGRRIFSASEGNAPTIENLSPDARVVTLRGHIGSVTLLVFSPDAVRVLAVIGRILKVWDAQSGEELFTIAGHSANVTACAYSPDARWIFSASADNFLKVWDAQTGGEFASFFAASGLSTLSVGRAGRSIAAADDLGQFYVLEPMCLELEPPVVAPAYVHQFDSAEWGQQARVTCGWCGHRFILSALVLAAITHAGEAPFGETGHLRQDARLSLQCPRCDEHLRSAPFIVDNRNLAPREFIGRSMRLATLASKVTTLAYQADGGRILSGGSDDELKIWDAETGKEVGSLVGDARGVAACAYSPDGKRLASASRYDTLRVWDAERGVCIAKLQSYSGSSSSCAFSPDGRRIVAGTFDTPSYDEPPNPGTLQIWDTYTEREIARFTGHTLGVRACEWSPDGQTIVSASHDDTLKLWDAETGEQLVTMSGHRGSVTSCAYSPDGRVITSSSEDGSLKMWDASTGAQLATLAGHTSSVEAFAYSPDGRRIVSGSLDQTLKEWDLEAVSELSAFVMGAAISAVSMARPAMLVAGDQLGRIHTLQLVGFEPDPLFVTLVRLWRFPGSGWRNRILSFGRRGEWAEHITARCRWCGQKFIPEPQVLNAVASIAGNFNSSPRQSDRNALPSEAFREPELFCDCPHCNKPLRFNPFIVDNRDHS